MAYITIVQASKDFKVTRSRIYRAIDNGSLTAHIGDDGTKLVDPSDMVRIFGSNKEKKIVSSKSEQPVLQQSEQLIEMLKEQLKKSEEREQYLKSEIANIRKDFDDFKLLIAMKTPSPTDTKTEQSEHIVNTQNDTTQTAQVEQCNDVVIQSMKKEKEVELVKPILRGLLNRFLK